MNNKKNVRVISFYLPQFHPIPENDAWWGKGFTEWRSVTMAKKLFPGHYQPHIPADLGFYDLRIPEVREQQARMAKEAGVEGFCYWHYWFGGGKQLLERPFNEVVDSGKPDFPFCLGWGNHSWDKKLWDRKGTKEVLIEQQYLGEEDDTAHFMSLLKAFKDPRYIKVNGKCFFLIHNIANLDALASFIKTWRKLAEEHGIGGFYFVAHDYDSRTKRKLIDIGFDAIYNDDTLNIHHHLNIISKVFLFIFRNWFKFPTIFSYKRAMKYMLIEDCRTTTTIPTIAPSWDHSPRSSRNAFVLTNPKPEYFYELTKKAIDMVKNKPEEERIIILKSWNEWGEGNHMEPDMKYGMRYLDMLKKALSE